MTRSVSSDDVRVDARTSRQYRPAPRFEKRPPRVGACSLMFALRYPSKINFPKRRLPGTEIG